MTDKPQTVGDQIRAMEPQEANGRVNPREAWEAARNQAAALADAATPTGWVIANGNNNRWRCVWEWESNVEWTDDITQALKFATRDDAERYSKEDEDAWLIYQVGIPPTTTPVVGAEQAGYVRQAVSDEGPQPRALKTCKGCRHFKSEYWREPSGDGETYDSGTSADCLKAGRNISSYCGSEPAPPDWCPCAAIEPDPTPALGWKAMQTAAAEAVRLNAWAHQGTDSYSTGMDAGARHQSKVDVDAILALPGPTDAQALAEAVKLSEVQELVKTAKWIGVVAQTTGGTAGPDIDLIEAIDVLANALAQIGGAA